ncbi:hypothetical protein F5I97DRAFT_144068 [Phlebopus sp. FC_14]|nr:hypothetical protein F5I97DRAFT_144068 [Phlebopus sp. FC_14]
MPRSRKKSAPSACVVVKVCWPLQKAAVNGKKLLTKLEWVWGMKYPTPDVAHPLNIVHLRADWRMLFGKGQWLLVPELRDLEALEKLSKTTLANGQPSKDLNKDQDRKEFTYHFLPKETMSEPICRFEEAHNGNSSKNIDGPMVEAQPSAYDVHFFPVDTLPPLKSHVCLRFIVFNCTRQASFDICKMDALISTTRILHSKHRTRWSPAV